MRFLNALFLAFLSINARASCNPGVLEYYPTVGGSLIGVCGQYGPMVLSGGTAPAVSTPIQGFGPYQAGAMHSLPAALQAAMGGLTAYSIKFRCNMITFPGNEFPWSGQDGGVNFYFNFLGNIFRWGTEDGGSNFADSTITASTATTYDVWLTYDGTTKRLYVNNFLAASQVHAGALPANGASMHFGAAWPPAAIFPTDGYLGDFILMNKAVIPPFDPISSTQRCPEIEKVLELDCALPKWLVLGMALLKPRQLHARTSSSFAEQRFVMDQTLILRVQRTVVADKTAVSRYTPTRTVTPGVRQASPTPTPRISPTVTPARTL